MPKPVLISPHIQSLADALPHHERHEVSLALARLPEDFGQPHLHAGLDIRKLHHHLFECRAGLHTRLLFQDTPDALAIVALGNHQDIHQLLLSGKFD